MRLLMVDNYDQFTANWIRDASGQVVAIDRRYINSGGTLTSGIELDSSQFHGDGHRGHVSV